MSDCIYGGRMEDEWDMRLLETFLSEICPDNVTDDGFTFDPDGLYHLKTLNDHEGLMEYLVKY